LVLLPQKHSHQSAEEHACLRRRGRRVGLAEELPVGWINTLRNANVPDEFAALGAELN